MKPFSFLLPISFCLGVSGVAAQTLMDLKIEPSQAVTGQTVTATIGLSDGGNCGVRFYWVTRFARHQLAQPLAT